jgi:hypothetical protein
LFDGKAVAFVIEAITDAGNPLQAGKDESRQCLETAVARQRKLILRFQITNSERALQHDRELTFEHRLLGRGNVEFVFDLADQLFQNVFDGDHAGG